QAPQVQRAELLHVTDEPDDGPLHAAADEGVPARRLDDRDDGVDVRFVGLRGHDDDHCCAASPLRPDPVTRGQPLRTAKAPDRPARGLSFGGLSAQRPADQPPGLVVPKEIDDVAHTDRLAHFPGAGPTRPRIWLTSPRMAVWRR